MKKTLLALCGILALAASAFAQTTGLTINHTSHKVYGPTEDGTTHEVPIFQNPITVRKFTASTFRLDIDPQTLSFVHEGGFTAVIQGGAAGGNRTFTTPDITGVGIVDVGNQTFTSGTKTVGGGGILDINGGTLNMHGVMTMFSGSSTTLNSGATLSLNPGATLTLSGTLNGTPAGGTLDLHNVTVTMDSTYVRTTGSYTNPSWIPGFDGSKITSGTVAISRGGTGQTSAANALTALLPAQSGHSGQYLKTDGTAATWQNASGGGGSAIDWGNVGFISSTLGNDSTGAKGDASHPFATCTAAHGAGTDTFYIMPNTTTSLDNAWSEYWFIGEGRANAVVNVTVLPGYSVSFHGNGISMVTINVSNVPIGLDGSVGSAGGADSNGFDGSAGTTASNVTLTDCYANVNVMGGNGGGGGAAGSPTGSGNGFTGGNGGNGGGGGTVTGYNVFFNTLYVYGGNGGSGANGGGAADNDMTFGSYSGGNGGNGGTGGSAGAAYLNFCYVQTYGGTGGVGGSVGFGGSGINGGSNGSDGGSSGGGSDSYFYGVFSLLYPDITAQVGSLNLHGCYHNSTFIDN